MDKVSEQELQAASIAPRVTPSNIEANINSEHWPVRYQQPARNAGRHVRVRPSGNQMQAHDWTS